MTTTTETTTTGATDGFTAAERAALKQRAAELRAEGRAGAKKADGLTAVLARIAAMTPKDRMLAERVHLTVLAAAPDLTPKTWYGMPAYANAAGKIVVFFQDAGKFKSRYSTLGFNDDAALQVRGSDVYSPGPLNGSKTDTGLSRRVIAANFSSHRAGISAKESRQ